MPVFKITTRYSGGKPQWSVACSGVPVSPWYDDHEEALVCLDNYNSEPPDDDEEEE